VPGIAGQTNPNQYHTYHDSDKTVFFSYIWFHTTSILFCEQKHKILTSEKPEEELLT